MKLLTVHRKQSFRRMFFYVISEKILFLFILVHEEGANNIHRQHLHVSFLILLVYFISLNDGLAFSILFLFWLFIPESDRKNEMYKTSCSTQIK